MTRRLWSASALLLVLAALALAIWAAIRHFPSGVTVWLCIVAAIGAAWVGASRRGFARIAGFTVAGALAIAAALLVIFERNVFLDVIVFVAMGAALVSARAAFRVHVALPRLDPPSHPVLFYNPKSGGGKATRFNLPDAARSRGIEPIELKPGDDLEQLVRDAVGRGANGLAMAGGDGSQAVVASIAAVLELPYACIPAGTRNHFALDLGVDRNDVVGALDAFVNGGERRVDLSEVNGRVFVNNVSLGMYAEAVQRPGYRAAKLQTLLDTVPDAIGPEAEAPALRWQGPDGPQSAVAILISNNQYRLGTVLGSGTRPRLDHGVLGITVLAPIAQDGTGGGKRRLTMEQWTSLDFVISADDRTPAGIDGEAVELDPPLRFQTLPSALRVRIAPSHPGASPSALEPAGALQTIAVLAQFAVRGDAPALDSALDAAR
jgi:diacylglycerol kinase family enzyme